METKVLLIYPGPTDWHQGGKLLGRADIALNATGREHAERLAGWLEGLGIGEILSSPLVRALDTAKTIGNRLGIEIARDHRLIELDLGRWQSKTMAEVMASDEYAAFLEDPLRVEAPGGETFQQVKQRASAALEQALEDNPAGATIAVVTHARVIRVLLAHYLGAPPATYHRLRLQPGSVSVLAFTHDSHRPWVLATGWMGPSLSQLLAAR
ncbi:histidine phosphatase family protein [Haliangium ochraceum]|uniref:histidine phosphatase family protein n=1 Tax=Haliangium ochraceum TaxID=80816 RepID=UPI00019BAB50|nr:histidine phosphatase family protein [Haliangium ochraceum]